MGLPKDLHLKGNEFSNVATAFSIAFVLYEIPNGEWALLFGLQS